MWHARPGSAKPPATGTVARPAVHPHIMNEGRARVAAAGFATSVCGFGAMTQTFNNSGDFRGATVIQGSTISGSTIVGARNDMAGKLDEALAEVRAALDALGEEQARQRQDIESLVKQTADAAAKNDTDKLSSLLTGLRGTVNTLTDAPARLVSAVQNYEQLLEWAKGLGS